jgi:thioredoxin-like negative regulator of GroEL
MKPSFSDRTPPSDSQIRDYFQILKQDSKSRVFAALAEALIRRGRLTEAEDICRLGLEANPEFSDGHLAYARVLFYLFRYKEAFEEVKVALGLDRNNVEAYLIAAEIFLARSQKKAASEACLKVIDLDPENQQARKILKRIGADEQAPANQKDREASARMTTDSFKATAGTSPGRRAMKLGSKPSLSDPFRQLLHEAGEQASEQLDLKEQPFSPLSSGSQPPVPPDLSSEDFDVPTKREKSPRRPDGTPIPKLPDHPPTPVPDLAPVSGGSQPSSQFEGASDGASSGAMVDRIQAVIDSYADRVTTDPYDHQLPPKIPRAGRILTLLGLLALLAAIGFAIVYGLRSQVKSGVPSAAEPERADTSLLLTDTPPPPEKPPSPPEEKPEEASVEEAAAEEAAVEEPPPVDEEVAPATTAPKKSVKKKTSKRKKRKKRRKRRRRRRR